ncbi:MAG: carnitine dehydratase, partial [Dehalococcoidia bacterium]|nr:carnitine dehydratase [Dehalococcoidia bacterium]
MHEPQSNEALEKLWTLAQNPPASLNKVRFTGMEPSLPSIYKTGILAQSTIAAAALASAEIWQSRTGLSQTVTVDIDAASASFRSENYLRVNGNNRFHTNKLKPENNIHGFYRCGDDGWIQLHANYPQHRKDILQTLRCDGLRKSVSNKLLTMSALEAENKLTNIGLPAGKMRTVEEWSEHPQGHAVARMPLFTITKIGDAAPIKLSQNPKRPLEGIKTLDLTKVIAGPLIGRTLAEHGADVIWVNGPHLDLIESLVIDMSRG